MKLVRYGAAGREKPGIIAEDGKIRDLASIVKDIDGAMLASGGLAKIKKANLKRMKPVRRQAAARPLRRQRPQLHRHRPELFRPRRRSRHAGAERADHLQQGADLHLRPERRHHRPEGLDQARLGNRDRHRHRQARALSDQGKHQGGDRRLFPVERRLGARIPDHALGRSVEQGQRLRDLRPDRPLVRHQGRDEEPAEPQHVARRQRREAPARQHQDHDLRLRIHRLVLLAVLRHGAGRHHHHRHAAGRRARHEAGAASSSRPATSSPSASTASANRSRRSWRSRSRRRTRFVLAIKKWAGVSPAHFRFDCRHWTMTGTSSNRHLRPSVC